MKKITKSILTLLLAVLMVVGVWGTSVSAEETHPTATLTINNVAAGERFNVWKIVDITYSDEKNALTYSYTTEAAAYFGSFTVEEFMGLDGVSLKEKLAGLSSHISSNPTLWEEPLGGLQIATSDSIEINNLKAGGYYIEPTATQRIYDLMFCAIIPTINLADPANPSYEYKNVEIDAKHSDVGVTKFIKLNAPAANFSTEVNMSYSSVDPAATKSQAMVQTVIDVPKYAAPVEEYVDLKLVEYIPEGFSYNTGSITVKVANSADDSGVAIALPDSAYTIADGKITINFSGANYDYIKQYSSVRVEYTLTANSGDLAAKDGDSVVSNNLKSEYTYSKYPYTKYEKEGNVLTNNTKEASVKVYFGGLEILKVDSNNASKTLVNAEFDLYRLANADEEGSVKLSIEGTENDVIKLNTSIKTDTDGKYEVKGLTVASVYYLVETKAPTAYKLDSVPKSVTIGMGSADGCTLATIVNSEASLTLPTTGATGMVMFTVAGLAIMGVAVAMVVSSTKGNKAK